MAIKKYTNGAWVSASYRKYGTETDAITTLPTTIIGDGTPISSYTIKGNTEQTGTPTPENPIMPIGCGERTENLCDKNNINQGYGYKLPITLGGTTTNIYLGEVQSTRRIKKLVLTGEEIWGYAGNVCLAYMVTPNSFLGEGISVTSTHYEAAPNKTSYFQLSDKQCCLRADGNYLWLRDNDYSTVADFKSYLAAQYAAGTPVTVWYVLEEPETAVVNEPLMKIGDYADSVSGTNLVTSGTAQELDVGTTLKPSELNLTYHGWHEHEDTKFTT